MEQSNSSTASKKASSGILKTNSTPQPPAKGRKRSQNEVLDESFVREIVMMDKRRAEREDRHAERLEMRSTIDGQQVAATCIYS